MKDATPIIFIIFGITDERPARMILPALLGLYTSGKLPAKFAIVGFTLYHLSKEDFRQTIREQMNISPGQFREEDVKHFIDHIYCEQGAYDKLESYSSLSFRVKSIDDSFRRRSNKLLYLLNNPKVELIIGNLARVGITSLHDANTGWTRVLLEKPFGNNFESAKKLERCLAECFNESQIFRVDHYLAKEGLQNVLAFRFANSVFEPLWNRDHIEKIHIKLFEKNGIGMLGNSYDHTGALRDIAQNHILQILAHVAMNRPNSFDSQSIRRERADVFRNLRKLNKKTITTQFVRGQYEGYKNEHGVNEHTQIETYFRIEAYIDNTRWKGIPFYLESGKALAESKVEFDIYFKTKNIDNDDRQNILTFRIQPDEGIKLRFWAKTPDFDMKVEPKNMRFKYSDFKSSAIPIAYEKVIYDAINGDQTIFVSTDEILYSWKYIDSITSNMNVTPLGIYRKGAEDVI
jgi:glucose-6-phosphate 1-dehydrogenase